MFVKLLFDVLSMSVGMRANAYGCDRTESVRRDRITYENLLVMGEQVLSLPCFQLVVLRTAEL